MVPLMCAEVREEKASGKNIRIPVIRTSPDRAHVKNLPARKRPRDEYEGEKQGKKERTLSGARAHGGTKCAPREGEEERRRGGKDLRNKLP